MSIINGYATLSEYKAHVTASGQTMSTDSTDDGVIENLIESASRFIDQQTRRTFYPRVATNLYDVPGNTNDARLLYLDDDLLAVLTLTNGDAVVLTTTDYRLLPANKSPKYGIRLKDSSTYFWEDDSSGNTEDAISVYAIWGYHENYTARAWSAAGTLNAAITTTSASTFSMTTGHSLQATGGQIVRIDNELLIIASAGANTITPVARGDNGSTAATHLTSTVVYVWNVLPEIQQAALEIAVNAYHRRFGQNMTGASSVTPSGVVVGPRDVSETAAQTIANLRSIT